MYFIPKIQYFEDDGRSMELTFRTENFVPNLSTKERSESLPRGKSEMTLLKSKRERQDAVLQDAVLIKVTSGYTIKITPAVRKPLAEQRVLFHVIGGGAVIRWRHPK